MPIAVDLCNLIIEKKVVRDFYRGGEEQFRKDTAFDKIKKNSEDDMLFSMAKMNPDEFSIDPLIKGGLHWDKAKGRSDDFVIHSRYGGFVWSPKAKLKTNMWFIWHMDDLEWKVKRAEYLGSDEFTFGDLEKSISKDPNFLKTF